MEYTPATCSSVCTERLTCASTAHAWCRNININMTSRRMHPLETPSRSGKKVQQAMNAVCIAAVEWARKSRTTARMILQVRSTTAGKTTNTPNNLVGKIECHIYPCYSHGAYKIDATRKHCASDMCGPQPCVRNAALRTRLSAYSKDGCSHCRCEHLKPQQVQRACGNHVNAR